MIKIRNVKESDIKSIATIHLECWKKAYAGILPENYLRSLSLASFEKRWTNGMSVNNDVVRLVVLEKSIPIGFIVGLENRTPEKCPVATGEIWAIYVHPDHWEKGAGKLLFREFQEVMKAKGYKKLFLWVLEKNERGRAFYEALGGELYPATLDLDINGEKFAEVAYVF
jgi:ribosomal protein S18 acetylase RimI-like enzyme